MNSATYVDNLIASLKTKGIPLSDAAWQAALACVGWAYVFGARGQYCTPANRRARYSDDHPTIKTACSNFDGDASCTGCKWYPGGERTRFFDCRGFTYWILLQIFGWKLQGAGATSQWNTAANWKAKGSVADGIPQGVIVCVFYKDKKNPKVMAHTGLYYNGETVECSSGVQHSKTLNQKWTDWAVPACVDGVVPKPTPAPAPTTQITRPTLRKGNRNAYVKEMQIMLDKLGYNLGICGVDGDYGTATEKAVKEFQRDHGLTQDGICGPKTWAALEEATDKISENRRR